MIHKEDRPMNRSQLYHAITKELLERDVSKVKEYMQKKFSRDSYDKLDLNQLEQLLGWLREPS